MALIGLRKVHEMNVGELRKILACLPDNMEIILQKDSEGNGYSPLHCADRDAIYVPETTWYGNVYSLEWSHVDVDMEPEDWKKLKENNPEALILAPVN